MAARKTTADVMREQIEKLKAKRDKQTGDYERKRNALDNELGNLNAAIKLQIDALESALAKLEQKP